MCACRKITGKDFVNFLKNNWLSLAMFAAIITGAALGISLRKVRKWTDREIMYIDLLGQLFMNLLRGICVPLMTTCIIVAFATIDSKLAKIFGVQVFLFVFATKVIAIAVGMTVAVLVKPGKASSALKTTSEGINEQNKESIDNFLDVIYNIFPDNMVDVFFRQTTTNITTDTRTNTTKYVHIMTKGSNMLGIVTLSMFIGMGMKAVGGKEIKSLLDVVLVLDRITFKIVDIMMIIAPILLIFLIAGSTIKIDLSEFVSSVGIYALSTSLLHIAFFIIIYSLIIVIFTRKNPFKFYLGFMDGITTSFAIGSTMASLPVAVSCLGEKMGYEKNIVAFIVPVCIAISKDGAALNLSFTAIYFAQRTNTSIDASGYCLIALFSMLLSLAVPGVPQGVLLMLMVILSALGIPPKHVFSIIAVDVIVDRISTMVNVFGAAVCVCVVDSCTRKKRQELEKLHEGHEEDRWEREPKPLRVL